TAMIVTGTGLTGVGMDHPATVLDVYGRKEDKPDLFQVANNEGPAIYTTAIAYTGIRTTTPAYPLDVQGDANVDNTLLVGANSTTGLLHVVATSTGSYGYANLTEVSNNLTKALVVSNSGDKFVVYGDGHTIIGSPSTTPNVYSSSNPNGYSLYVEGGIMAHKYKCALSSDLTNWSDYVFDKNYKLAPLADVEAYIKKNKHLPGVPSTADVHRDGIDLAEMDATLLKKVEELTLYVLELKKDNEVMKAQLNNIKK
ncbi:MAG: hypothetical protein JWO03_3877, partial [Bacteroidetes bacterium]|nr:hypothetical protein [Bacteroidota bacterium]